MRLVPGSFSLLFKGPAFGFRRGCRLLVRLHPGSPGETCSVTFTLKRADGIVLGKDEFCPLSSLRRARLPLIDKLEAYASGDVPSDNISAFWSGRTLLHRDYAPYGVLFRPIDGSQWDTRKHMFHPEEPNYDLVDEGVIEEF